MKVLHEQCPETEIIIQGVLPVTIWHCRHENLDITHWNSFNTILARICEEHDVVFLNFADQLMDEEGYLRLELASDAGVHLNEDGEAIWVRAVRAYAASQMRPDAVIEYPPSPVPETKEPLTEQGEAAAPSPDA